MLAFIEALDPKTTQLKQKQISVLVLHLIFCCLNVSLSFCRMGITLKIRLCYVLKNIVLWNLLCVWILIMIELKGSVDPSLQSSTEAKVCDFEICRDGAYPDKHTRFICNNTMKI